MCNLQSNLAKSDPLKDKTGGADSGSGGSGMECMQLRSQPGPFHYLISEQAKSLVALQELQNEVGALLEFRDLVIETFPNLRSKMAPSTPAGGARRDWEPGVRVRRKLAGSTGDTARTKPQPSVQDSGFSTETSCGKDAHASASRSRPLEDELWALLDTIQRKGVRVRDEAEFLRGELDERRSETAETAEESFARALSNGCGDCADVARLRVERDALLARTAQLEAAAALSPPPPVTAAPGPLGRLDATLETPTRPPLVPSPDSKKFAAILRESNPVELQRQLLTSTVQNQVYCDQLKRAAEQKTLLLERLERAREINEDLKFRLEEQGIELEGARARVRELEGRRCPNSNHSNNSNININHSNSNTHHNDSLERSRDAHSSMRDMEPLQLPDEETRLSETPKRRASRIPLHTGHKGAAPRPPSAHSGRSVRSGRKEAKPPPPALRRPAPNEKVPQRYQDSLTLHSRRGAELVAEYVARTERLAPLFPRLHTVRARPLPDRLTYESPNLALELTKSILYEPGDSDSRADSLWNGRPQQYFESMNYGKSGIEEPIEEPKKDFESDSLAQ